MIFAKNFARNYVKENNTWDIRGLVDLSQRPSKLVYCIEDCRILGQVPLLCRVTRAGSQAIV